MENQAKFEAHSYVNEHTGEERANIEYSGDTATVLAMGVSMIQDIMNEVSKGEKDYNMLLGSVITVLCRDGYEEVIENE